MQSRLLVSQQFCFDGIACILQLLFSLQITNILPLLYIILNTGLPASASLDRVVLFCHFPDIIFKQRAFRNDDILRLAKWLMVALLPYKGILYILQC